jgi:hypothetical protein
VCANIWIPYVLQTPVVFQTVALNAAIFYIVHMNTPESATLAAELLWVKQKALNGLVQYLVHGQQHIAPSSPPTTVRSTNSDDQRGSNASASEPQDHAFESTDHTSPARTPTLASLPPPNPNPYISDDIIAATVKVACFEALYGDPNAYHIHMGAAARMVRARGGLAALGLNGFLARLIVFIDTNCAAILGARGRLYMATEYGESALFPRRLALQRTEKLAYMTLCGGGKTELLAGEQYASKVAARLPEEVAARA